ncbi:hypothetical protein SAB0368 [Staphylococcus aureus RF122]|nr:hypothetical protein SAB0368 [Staphylococcus aureus RF122]
MATLKDVKTGKKEILPSTAKDKNGKNVTLIYFEKDGKLGFLCAENTKRTWSREMRFWYSGWRSDRRHYFRSCRCRSRNSYYSSNWNR